MLVVSVLFGAAVLALPPAQRTAVENGLEALSSTFARLTNLIMAFAPLGAAKFAVNFIVAGLQVVLVGLFFMRLNRASSLVRLTAVAGLFWLTFLFIMAGTDYLTRP